MSSNNGTVTKSRQPSPQFLDGIRVEYVEKGTFDGVVIKWQGLLRMCSKKVTFRKKEGYLTFELKPVGLYKGSLKNAGEYREGSLFEFNSKQYALTNPRVLVEK